MELPSAQPQPDQANQVDLSVFQIDSYRAGPIRFGWVGNAQRHNPEIADMLIPAMQGDFQLSICDDLLPETNRADFFNAIDVLLVPADRLGSGATVLEALACGVFPVCVHASRAATLFPADGGLLVEPTAPALRAAMRWCEQNAPLVRARGYRNGQLVALRHGSDAQRSAPARRARILILADVKGWIFERHANFLKQELAPYYDIDVAYQDQGAAVDDSAWDLVYPLEWALVPEDIIRDKSKWVTGIRSHVSWERYGAEAVGAYLRKNYSMVHVVSHRLLGLLQGQHPQLCVLSHGIKLDHFTPQSTVSAEAGALAVGWAGNSAVKLKGFSEFIEPLESLPGVQLKYFGYSNTMLSFASMKDFYEAIDVYVCCSLTEGNNNSLMEAAAMGRAIVTTDVGTVPEYLVDGESALIVPRTLEAIQGAVERLRDDPALRARLGAAARQAVRIFSWEAKLLEHRAFFDHALRLAGWQGTTAKTGA